ncbi:MAG: hypothetical protein KDD62_16110, partial [Bdellovibrionales bacterium]|nr:hypothetical protein [Bdellovibrionales bacterium]
TSVIDKRPPFELIVPEHAQGIKLQDLADRSERVSRYDLSASILENRRNSLSRRLQPTEGALVIQKAGVLLKVAEPRESDYFYERDGASAVENYYRNLTKFLEDLGERLEETCQSSFAQNPQDILGLRIVDEEKNVLFENVPQMLCSVASLVKHLEKEFGIDLVEKGLVAKGSPLPVVGASVLGVKSLTRAELFFPGIESLSQAGAKEAQALAMMMCFYVAGGSLPARNLRGIVSTLFGKSATSRSITSMLERQLDSEKFDSEKGSVEDKTIHSTVMNPYLAVGHSPFTYSVQSGGLSKVSGVEVAGGEVCYLPCLDTLPKRRLKAGLGLLDVRSIDRSLEARSQRNSEYTDKFLEPFQEGLQTVLEMHFSDEDLHTAAHPTLS